MLGLNNYVILISGASSGLGRALALACAREGMSLALCGRDALRLSSVYREIAGLGVPVIMRSFDVRDSVAIGDFVNEVEGKWGRIDILVNNAGLNGSRDCVENISLEAWDEMMAVNVTAPLHFIQRVLPGMKDRRSGHIVNILSTVCLFSSENIGAYTASKSAMRGLSGVLRKEVRPFDICVSDVLPGGIDTAFRAESRPQYMSAESVATSIMNLLKMPKDICCHELVLRPMVESNMP